MVCGSTLDATAPTTTHDDTTQAPRPHLLPSTSAALPPCPSPPSTTPPGPPSLTGGDRKSMDSELPFGYARREKRSATQMDVDGSSSPTWPNRFVSPGFASAASAMNLPPTNEMADGVPRRFQGDGYDFRRPVVSSSNSTSNVIDLTDEGAGPSSERPSVRPARPPRFGREIIDVEGEDNGTAEAPDSPEIQFVSARRIDPPQRRNPTPYLDVDDEDEVEFLSENPLPESERRPRTRIQDLLEDPAFRARAPHLRGSLERHEAAGETRRVRDAQIARMERLFAASRNRRTPRPLSAGPGPRPVVRIAPLRGRMPTHIHVGFIAPNLNFGAVGFNMGMGFADEPEAPPPPPPTYDAPQAAPQGFTRSPQEEEVLVCPNCEDELCTGESDQKRQVWLVKGCGHVYCGECMANRHVSKKGKEKGPSRTKPFKECVVDDCFKRVSSKSAVIQVFL